MKIRVWTEEPFQTRATTTLPFWPLQSKRVSQGARQRAAVGLPCPKIFAQTLITSTPYQDMCMKGLARRARVAPSAFSLEIKSSSILENQALLNSCIKSAAKIRDFVNNQIRHEQGEGHFLLLYSDLPNLGIFVTFQTVRAIHQHLCHFALGLQKWKQDVALDCSFVKLCRLKNTSLQIQVSVCNQKLPL